MQNLIQSDVFFFITSVAVIVVTIFVLVVLWYLISILRNVKEVSDIIKKETLFFSGDLADFRKKIKKLFDSLIKLITGKIKKSDK